LSAVGGADELAALYGSSGLLLSSKATSLTAPYAKDPLVIIKMIAVQPCLAFSNPAEFFAGYVGRINNLKGKSWQKSFLTQSRWR